MNSETKTKNCKYWCIGCHEYTNELHDDNIVDLCKKCNDKYDNKTEYCSLECCLGHGCDESC